MEEENEKEEEDDDNERINRPRSSSIPPLTVQGNLQPEVSLPMTVLPCLIRSRGFH